MIKGINLAEREKSIKYIETFKKPNNSIRDVKISNSHIANLNHMIGRKIFKKNSLYISSATIHDLLQPLGGKNQHNYHALTPADIFMVLLSIKDPKYVFVANTKRYAFISVETISVGHPLMIIVETGASLLRNLNAKINKVVTIYPKSDVDKYIEKLEDGLLIYEKPQKRGD